MYNDTADKWGTKAMCITKDACDSLCRMVDDCTGYIAQDGKSRCYMVTSTCAPRDLDFWIQGFRYYPKNKEKEHEYQCTHWNSQDTQDDSSGRGRRLGVWAALWEKISGAIGLFSKDDDNDDDDFDVADAAREGMFEFDGELD